MGQSFVARSRRGRPAPAGRRTVPRAVEEIVGQSGLRDCFSIDFRIDAAGLPTFFEFEVCPAVTIYDFQTYLAGRGLTLGAALAKAMRFAFARRMAPAEA